MAPNEKKVKKIVFGRRIYLAPTTDGLVFGKRNGSDKHITILQKDGRSTMHITDKDVRKNIFGDQTDYLNTELESLILKPLSKPLKRPPKFVYPINLNYYKIKRKGKTAFFSNQRGTELIDSTNRITCQQFLNSNYAFGATSKGSWILHLPNGVSRLSKREMRSLQKKLKSNKFLRALIDGFDFLKEKKSTQCRL